MRHAGIFYSVIIAAGLFAGCVRDRDISPIAPPSDLASHGNVLQTSAGNRYLWGFWEIGISSDRSNVEIVPMRTGSMHFNVLKLLEQSPCSNCLTVGNVKVQPDGSLSVTIGVKHPFPGLLKFTGFDVRGIVIGYSDFTFPASGQKIALGDGMVRLLNPDGFTSLFNPTDFPESGPSNPLLKYDTGKWSHGADFDATLNPYLAYSQDKPRRMFAAGTSDSKIALLQVPSGPLEFGYAVDACWTPVGNVTDPEKDFPPEANCLEAYKINVNVDSTLPSWPGSTVPIEVEVYDHQGADTISSVTLEAPGIFDGAMPLDYSSSTSDESFLFSGIIMNQLAAGEGIYPILVRVTDKEVDPNLGPIDAWQVGSVTTTAKGGWARTWGSFGDDMGTCVATDLAGNIYVGGRYEGIVDFNPGSGVDNHISAGLFDCFVSKFDQSGNFLWAKTWGGSGWDDVLGIAVDLSGNVYTTGRFWNTVDFDPGTGVDNHTSGGQVDAFLSKLDSSGNFQWARTWGGSEGDNGAGVAVDQSGNPYVTGCFTGYVDLDPGSGSDYHQSLNGETNIFSVN